MHSSVAIKNEIAKDVVKAVQNQITAQSTNVPNININTIPEIKKEFWIGKFKISIKIH